MKILFLNNGFPTIKNPQYTTYAETMVECLKKAGYNVDLYVIRYNYPITGFYKLIKYIKYWGQSFFLNIKTFDIIYINHLPFIWTILFHKDLSSKKVFIHWHGNDLVSNSPFNKNILKLIQHKILNYKHIVPSYFFKRKLMEKLNIPEYNIFISPSGGVNTNIFTLQRTIQKDNIFTIGFSGALSTSKGANILLEIIRIKGEIETTTKKKILFKIINYGNESTYYINKFLQESNDIIIEEKMKKHQMPSFYNSISLLLHLSTQESLGLVVLEAMSCNRPVVTFNLCAFPEFVRPNISGELAVFSTDLTVSIQNIKKSIEKVIINYSNYSPRNIIEKEYSEENIINFYKKLNEY